MKKIIWKLRYAKHMCSRMSDFSPSNLKFAWYNAGVSWEEMDGPNSDPIDSADEEISCWA
nr:hypothetical protein [uncultured Pseudomonas sp.]